MRDGYSRWRLATLVVCFVALYTFGPSLSAAPSRPNVLLILSDDHSAPHVSHYEDENTKRFKVTPNLQKFAEQGITPPSEESLPED